MLGPDGLRELIESQPKLHWTDPRGTGIVHLAPEHPSPFTGVQNKYIAAENTRAVSPQPVRSLENRLSVAVSPDTLVLLVAGYGYSSIAGVAGRA